MERCTETYYEGYFEKYADGSYVTDHQEDDFNMFHSGYQARAAQKAVVRVDVEAMCEAYWGENCTKNYNDLDNAFKDEMHAGMKSVLSCVSEQAKAQNVEVVYD